MLTGMQKALEKRPVSREAIEAAAARICHKLRSLGEREIASRSIGEMVMEELRHLDEVGYVRFASVYRSFQDLDAFRTEIDQLRRHRRRRGRGRNRASFVLHARSKSEGCRPRNRAPGKSRHRGRGRRVCR